MLVFSAERCIDVAYNATNAELDTWKLLLSRSVDPPLSSLRCFRRCREGRRSQPRGQFESHKSNTSRNYGRFWNYDNFILSNGHFDLRGSVSIARARAESRWGFDLIPKLISLGVQHGPRFTTPSRGSGVIAGSISLESTSTPSRGFSKSPAFGPPSLPLPLRSVRPNRRYPPVIHVRRLFTWPPRPSVR